MSTVFFYRFGQNWRARGSLPLPFCFFFQHPFSRIKSEKLKGGTRWGKISQKVLTMKKKENEGTIWSRAELYVTLKKQTTFMFSSLSQKAPTLTICTISKDFWHWA